MSPSLCRQLLYQLTIMIKISNFLKALVFVIHISALTCAQGLELHYNFDELTLPVTIVSDASGNGHDGMLVNGAEVTNYGGYKVLDLGSSNGYLDMGTDFGVTVSSLTDFSIATYLFIDESTALDRAGNFVWSLGNSNDMAKDANGGMFFTAKDTRFVISEKHWVGDQSVKVGGPLEQGAWKHVVYTQSSSEGKLFIDGVLKVTSSVNITPSTLGATDFNYIGRSLYSSDAYLKDAKLYDFRVYSKALNVVDIKFLNSELNVLNASIDRKKLVQLSESMHFGDSIVSGLELLSNYDGISASWLSSDTKVVNASGHVFRRAIGAASATVTLTATFSKGNAEYSRDYLLTVLPFPSDKDAVQSDIDALVLEGNLTNLRESLTLPLAGLNGTAVTWESSNPKMLSHTGQLLNLSPSGSGTTAVMLTMTVSKGNSSQQKVITIDIAEDDASSAYLFSYFTGNRGDEEAIRFALSNDGYNYRALNDNKPIVESADISSTGGVRDPHILRGPDGWFYMVVTDMVSDNGWSSNRAMVMLKSKDLLNWSSSIVNIQEKYEDQDGLRRVWAPQTIYDASAGKFMLYWSMQYEGGNDIIYYAYANSTFTDIEGTPEQLFYHPTGQSCIDGDIIEKGGKFHLFFKTEGNGNGLKKAISDNLTSGYTLIDKYLQQTNVAVEGSSVFRMINSDKFILMYDMYSSGTYQFTESYDLANFSIVEEEITMNFHPRHGTVIPITQEEATSLASKWGAVSELYVHAVDGAFIQAGGVIINNVTKQIKIDIQGGDISSYDPALVTLAGATISPSSPADFSNGPVTYTLSIDGVGEVEYTVTVNTTVASVSLPKKVNEHSIYPNPVSDILSISSPFDSSVKNEIHVFDNYGVEVLRAPVCSEVSRLDIAYLSPAPYYLVYTLEDAVLWGDHFVVVPN